ncbi:hypothetical protein PLEOSDRAFT_169004 [Pleurotus ostreatus PC15]|uniref:Uncharacterized protein n=1 Tax=Pleurotus ostreatus (strain PC15) TaxID=1137138 RepID=A0A067NFH7_PLEO1|nr:hypothetical protein PLEOSDRAFT_169004 [Pleurotus ostreatus PC15]
MTDIGGPLKTKYGPGRSDSIVFVAAGLVFVAANHWVNDYSIQRQPQRVHVELRFFDKQRNLVELKILLLEDCVVVWSGDDARSSWMFVSHLISSSRGAEKYEGIVDHFSWIRYRLSYLSSPKNQANRYLQLCRKQSVASLALGRILPSCPPSSVGRRSVAAAQVSSIAMSLFLYVWQLEKSPGYQEVGRGYSQELWLTCRSARHMPPCKSPTQTSVISDGLSQTWSYEEPYTFERQTREVVFAGVNARTGNDMQNAHVMRPQLMTDRNRK